MGGSSWIRRDAAIGTPPHCARKIRHAPSTSRRPCRSRIYRDGRSLSDPETYRSIAESLELDPSAAVSSLFTAASKDAARADFVRARRLGAHFVSDAVVPRERRVRREIRFSDQYRGRSHPRPEHVRAGVCGGLTHPPCERKVRPAPSVRRTYLSPQRDFTQITSAPLLV